MPPQATSTTVLIIPLILNTLSAPPPTQSWAPVANTPEIAYQIGDLSSDDDPSADHPSWFPPVDICTSHFGSANATEASVLLLLLVSLGSQQDQTTSHCGRNNKKVNNRTAPWTSLSLEPGIYGAPRAGEEPVCSNPNISLDVGSFSFYNSSLLPTAPMIEVEDRQVNDHPVAVGVPALFGFVLCSLDGNGSFIPSIFQDSRRYTREVSRYRKSVSAAQPRKLLDGVQRNNLYDHRRFLTRKKDVFTAAGIAIGLALLVLLCSTGGLLYWCTRMSLLRDERHIQPADLCTSGPRRYSHRELTAATCGFSDDRKIGRGGFGPVYRGYFQDQGCDAAIKVLQQGSSLPEQGRREFLAEVKVMTRLRHRNIVQLLGWSDGHGGLMLVYEFVPNGSLDKNLHDPQRLLAWPDRYKIALGVGSAILYLHTECEQRVLHGDIKPANILLDSSCNAKLGDFGLARLVDHAADSSPTTQVVAGTPGYMDPEFVSSQRPCVESDVFSFGVVLLEIACGRRPTTELPTGTPLLLNWVRHMYSNNSVLGVADRRLDGEFVGRQMTRVLVVGLWCTHHDQSERPSIAQAMDLLRREGAELPILDLMTHGADAVHSLEEIAYGDLSAGDSASEGSFANTTYHTSADSSCLLE